MGYLRYAKPVILLLLLVWFLSIIHPFTKEGVFIKEVKYPAALGLKNGDIIYSINGNRIRTIDDYKQVILNIKPNDTVSFSVLRETFPYSYKNITYVFVAEEKNNKTFLGLVVEETKFSNLKFSHTLVGGNKIILSSNQKNAVDVIKKRLEINKISDFSIYKNKDIYILTTENEEKIKPLIESKGKFYAKIGEEIFFTTDDVKSVCLTGFDCIMNLYQYLNQTDSEREVVWRYGFEVRISKEAGERFADLTKDLGISYCRMDVCILNSTIDYFIDGVKIGSEEIYSRSKGLPYERPIVGGEELTQEDAMKALSFAQSILEAGELDAKILGVEKYSKNEPILSIFPYLIILFSIIAGVVSMIFLRRWKILLTVFGLCVSELIIVVGVLTALNIIINKATLFSILFLNLVAVLIYGYPSYKLKKEGIITSKIISISREMTKLEVISLFLVAISLIFVPSFAAPVLIYLSTNLLLTKGMFLKEVEKIKSQAL